MGTCRSDKGTACGYLCGGASVLLVAGCNASSSSDGNMMRRVWQGMKGVSKQIHFPLPKSIALYCRGHVKALPLGTGKFAGQGSVMHVYIYVDVY